MPLTYNVSAPNLDTTPGIARDLLRALLRSADLEELSDTATLLTSELVTNVYLHSGDTKEVLIHVLLDNDRLQVTVHDDEARLPRPRSADPRQDPDGRGLALVAALADRWGVAAPKQRSAHVKGVWFELLTSAADA